MNNINKVIVGKNKAIELMLATLLAEGHLLLEDVPGVGKTLLARALAKSIGGTFHRIQFTPDLLPSDITGFNIYNQKEGRFVFQPGPVMSNILLADEINRPFLEHNPVYWKVCRRDRLLLMEQLWIFQNPFLLLPPKIPLNWKEHFLSLKHS